MPTVTNFPLQPAVARERIRALYREGKIGLPRSPGGAWEQVVTTRQIMLCLEHGEVVGKGVRNEHGHYLFRLRRYSAGVIVMIDLVLYVENGDWAAQIVKVTHE